MFFKIKSSHYRNRKVTAFIVTPTYFTFFDEGQDGVEKFVCLMNTMEMFELDFHVKELYMMNGHKMTFYRFELGNFLGFETIDQAIH